MANLKITQLPELTSPISTDILPIVDDPGGSPITKKSTLVNLMVLAPLLAGRSGGQILNFGLDAGDGGEIHSTVNGTKGVLNICDTAYIDEVNNRLGIGITVPTELLHLKRDENSSIGLLIENLTSGTAAASGIRLTVASATTDALALVDSAYTGVSDWADGLILHASDEVSRGLILVSNGNRISFQTTIGTDIITIDDDIIFIGNTAAVPTVDPTAGGFLYVNAGALTYRGSSGTITVLGDA